MTGGRRRVALFGGWALVGAGGAVGVLVRVSVGLVPGAGTFTVASPWPRSGKPQSTVTFQRPGGSAWRVV